MDLRFITCKKNIFAKYLNSASEKDGHYGKRKLAMKRTLRFGTWNVQGIGTKIHEVFKEIEQYNLDIVAFTEVKKKGKGIEQKDHYTFIYSGVPKEERGRSGVAIAIKMKYKRNIKSWEQINDRILVVEMGIKNHPLVIIAAYGPNEDAKPEKKDEFFNTMTSLLNSISNRKEIILMGDLNGRVGQRRNDPVVGQFGEDVVNSNGERIIEMCENNHLKIANGFYQHKMIHRYTWEQTTRSLKTIIDYVIVKQVSNLKILDVKVMRGPECGSDHHLLLAKIYFTYRRTNGTIKDTDDRTATIETIRYNIEGLKDDSTKFLYQIRLANKLTGIQEDTAEIMYEAVKSCIHQAANEALGILSKETKQYNSTPWWNDKLDALVKEKKELHRKRLETRTPQDIRNYQTKRKEVHREVKKTQNEYWEKVCSEVDEHIGNTRTNKAWKIIKNMRSQTKNTMRMSPINIQEWKNYYKDLLTEQRVEFMTKPIAENDNTIIDKPIVEEITSSEVKKSILQMKNGKAPGAGNIVAELLKAAPSLLMDLLAHIFNKCLLGEQVPKEWKRSIITSIHKKGSTQKCQNYRGISVICTVAKLYGRILKYRIENEFKESEEQNGFRAGRSCIDGVFTIKNIAEKRIERGRTVHMAFVDLQKAYDTVPLSKLWPCMENENISKVYVHAVKKLYMGCTSAVKTNNEVSEDFKITKGLRQGCTLAPLLFKIYLEGALKAWKRKCGSMGVPVGDKVIFTLLFADDQVVLSTDQDDLNYMLRKLKEEYEKWGLAINMHKTEYLIVGDENDRSDMQIGNETIKLCSSFKYLGVTISSTGKSTEDILNKVGQGRNAIRQLNSLLWSKSISAKTKTMLYKTIVQSICTYGSETWELNKKDRQKLLSLEMDFWRRSARISRLDHIRNDRIREIMKVEQTIIDTIEQKRLIWYGHLQRMDEDRWPKIVWQWVPQERRKRGRPPRSWKLDIEESMAARGLQEGDWQDRNYWRLRCEKRQRP